MTQNNKTPEAAETPQESETVATEKSPEELIQQKLKDAEQKYVYLYADFENFKKRSAKERQETYKFAVEALAAELIPVLDNFERALQYAKPDGDQSLVSGLQMVASQLRSTLEKHGVQIIPAMDQSFNPEFHEAVGQLPSPKPQGIIVEEQQKGYTLHGRLLRPSRVMVSAGPQN